MVQSGLNSASRFNGVNISIDLYGAGYCAESIRELSSIFGSIGLNCTITGGRTPAVGPELACDLAVSIVGGAALKAIIPAMEAAFDAIKRSAYSHIIEKNKVRISLPEACIVVDACPAAGLRLTDAEFTKIIRNVFSFIDSEENMLAEFNEILVPWDMNEVLSNLDRLALRIRAYDKWRITFKDGLCSVYDSFLKRWVG